MKLIHLFIALARSRGEKIGNVLETTSLPEPPVLMKMPLNLLPQG
jgi:hypothetical protein